MIKNIQCSGIPFFPRATLFALAIFCAAPSGRGGASPGPAEAALAGEILKATGVDGGIVVHLGCGGGRLTAALRPNDRYLVQGLDTDRAAVAEARKYLHERGLQGPVSVDLWDGSNLPYADNLVNLVVSERPVPEKEVMRVLRPRGVAYVKEDGRWTAAVKPRPPEMDEWTHNLHDGGGNAVARDRVVGPPRHLQWTAGPLWARSHGWTPSVSAMVSAGGRLFYICDESLPCVDGTVPSRWSLIARDAFNGVLLWKRPIPRWDSKDFSGTPGTGGGVTTGRFTMPMDLAKRLVAVGDTVFVTLGPDAPVTALDAATGREKLLYAGTDRADEILFTGGRLVLSIHPREKPKNALVRRGETPPPVPGKQVCAVEASSGRLLWKKGPFSGIRASREQDPFGRLELAAGDGRVFFLTPEAILCLGVDSGETLWRVERPALPESAVRRLGFAGMFEYLLAVLVYHDGVVLLAQPEPNTHHTYHTMPGSLHAFDAGDGRHLWKHSYGGWGHCTPPDVFVVGDLVWTHVNAETEFGSVWGNGYKAKDPSKVDYRIQALQLRTGKLIKELSTRDIFNVGHHHRCYRNRITERFLLASRRGVEFVDLASGENYQNHWIRSGCLLGDLPCNGLLYITPHPCGCYIAAKLTGFNALAPAGKERGGNIEDREWAGLLERGPAYGEASLPGSPSPGGEEWPTYRHDGRRSGATGAAVSTDLTPAWRRSIGTRPSALTVAGGKVFAACADTHTVHALSAADGEIAWSFTCGARVSSPPTISGGLAIFGSADGWIYCLRARDGSLAWRFRGAPRERRLLALGQLESAWPVPGSVLARDGVCWFAAGRSSYLDGGIHLYALDAETGRVVRRKVIYSPDPETGKITPEPSGFTVSGLLNDIPVTDGANIFIRQMNVSSPGARGRHLFTTGGFLDASWFNRTYWTYGKARTSGLMVLGSDVSYGVEVYNSTSRETVFRPGSRPYRLKCVPWQVRNKQAGAKKNRKAGAPRPRWEQRVAIRITALLRAGETLFAAGSPDIVDPDDPHGAWEGRKGGVLAAFSTAEGKKLAGYRLPSPPVWDGMAAVPGRLFLALENGEIACYGGAQ